MKILLINPTSGPISEYGSLAKAGTELPQLGLASVATSLLSNGHTVKIIDYHIQKMNNNQLLEILQEGQYELVGFSVYITTIQNTLILAKLIKKHISEIKICVGGPQVTLSPADFEKDFIDYVFIGEADYSIVELVNALTEGYDTLNIKGLRYKDGAGFKGNYNLNLVDDLDALPFVQLEKLYDLSSFYPPIYVRGKKVINVVSVRGCPFQCTFCAAAEINGRNLREMSVDRFVDYIERYVEQGYDSFMIYDDTFTINKKRTIQISKEIINRKLDISWNCWSRVNCVDLETLSAMKEAGCYYIMYGCESFNEKTLKKIKKGFSVEQSLEGIAIAKKAGLLVSSSFMIGLPGETKDDIVNTINQVNNSQLDIAIYTVFEPYQGTPIYNDAVKEGHWINCKYKNNLLIDQDKIWEPYSISRDEIEKLQRYAHRTFYLRPDFLNSLRKIFFNIPMHRKIRFIMSGLDYFFFSRLPFKKKHYNAGTRFK